MRCTQCGTPAFYKFETGHYLCIDCEYKRQQTLYYENAALVGNINFNIAQMENIAGFPGMFPRYELPSPPVNIGARTLNNINVTNSTIGVINTGDVQSIDASIGTVQENGDTKAAAAIKQLTEAILKTAELDGSARNEVLEYLSYIAKEATRPQAERKQSLGKRAIEGISNILPTASHLASVWSAVHGTLASLFIR